MASSSLYEKYTPKAQTWNTLRFGNGVFSIYVSLQKWIRSTLFYFHIRQWLDQWFPSLVSILHLPELRFASQLLLEPPVNPTTKQNNTDKKLDFSTSRVFVQCGKSENTKLSILNFENLFSLVPVGNFFPCYFRQFFRYLALRKCKNDCKIFKITLVQIFVH